jgi:release factor glutamine methyltransferase
VATSSAEPDPEVVAALRAAGCVFAEEEAGLLEAEAGEGGDLALMLARRVAGEPLEQVLGWAEFCGLRIRVVPGVFVPRRRTQALVEVARSLLPSLDHPPVVVDLCCVDVPGVELHAADIDPAAVGCARLNVTAGVTARVAAGAVHEGDLYDALPDHLRGRVDLLLVNAPYVPTDEIRLMPPEARLHEHHVALDGGEDGLDLHRRTAAGAPGWLAPGGSLLIESSPRQAVGTARCCVEAGLEVQVLGEDPVRVVRAISSPSGRLAE